MKAAKFQDPNLDILRAIAVLTVLATHLLEVLSGYTMRARVATPIVNNFSLGRIGVLLFFVHTALVLMQSMERSSLTGWSLARDFYTRRAFRIYPLSVALVLLCVGFAIPPDVVGEPYRWVGHKAFVLNLALAQNFSWEGSISAPLWSLPYEVQMYLVLPVIFCVLGYRGSLKRCLPLYAGAIIGAAYVRQLQFATCFFAGILAYCILSRERPKRQLHWGWWGATIVALIAAYVETPWRETNLAKNSLVCLFIALAIPFFRPAAGRIATFAGTIAKYSYSIYLCHTPLLWLFFFRLRWPRWWSMVAFSIALAVVSWLCYTLIEDPMIQVGKRIAKALQGRVADRGYEPRPALQL